MATPKKKQPALRHFIDLADIDAKELRRILDAAAKLKVSRGRKTAAPLAGKSIAMIFEKPSTRTRVSFEVGIAELGGTPLYLNRQDTQLGRGEPVADTAKVLSRYVDAVVIRAQSHFTLTEMAEEGSVPIVNALTNVSHPCQIMADILTFEEHMGPIKGKTLAWVGDGNNVAVSFIDAAAKLGFTLKLACPASLQPPKPRIQQAVKQGARITLGTDVLEAVKGAHAVITDTWTSMGDEEEKVQRIKQLKPYQVNDYLMSKAHKDAIFLHCLPAYRGQEVTPSVLDGPKSVVWDEAENRLHVQKAILMWCVGRL